jgi:hypothetical protein
MSGTKATRQQAARITRLLAQCEHAHGFRFEVPGAPSITVHVEPDGMGHWAVFRFGWQQPVTLGVDGWVPVAEVPVAEQFRWSVAEALDQAPALLDTEQAAHAAWQQQHEQARRAGQLAAVVDELLDPARVAVGSC